jgi:S1-C subfamily serine protease
MGNGASLGEERKQIRVKGISQWREDPSAIEEWQREVEEADQGELQLSQSPVPVFQAHRPPNVTQPLSNVSVERHVEPSSPQSASFSPVGANLKRLASYPSQCLHFESTVKIFTVSSRPNFLQPWQMKAQQMSTGSGFVIPGNRWILTNAHVVEEYTTVRVRKHGHPMKYNAEVLCVGYACDLALLEVKDEEFWEGLVPVDINPSVLPNLYENVMVVGYPLGGDNICVTRGVVSRITTLKYSPNAIYIGGPEILAIQIDAAINSGNSGGPVFLENGEMVGMAFSGYAGNADNIGYVIPCCIISNFMRDYKKNGKFTGIAELGFSYQWMENCDLKESMRMHPKASGILVSKIPPLGLQAKFIKRHDVVMEIEGVKIGDDGTVTLRKGERVDVEHLVSSHSVGETIEIKLLRNGKIQTIQCPLGPIPRIIPRSHDHRTPPSYYIVGGLVFSPLTTGLLFAATEAFTEDAWQASRNPKQHIDQELVILLSILAHRINNGYSINKLPLVKKVNGKKIRNLRHLRTEAESIREGFLNFELCNDFIITLDARKCRDTAEEILRMYAIPMHCSPDLFENEALKPAASVTISTFSLSTTKSFSS